MMFWKLLKHTLAFYSRDDYLIGINTSLNSNLSLGNWFLEVSLQAAAS